MINAKEMARITNDNMKPAKMEDIIIKIMENAKEGKDYCWIFGPMLAEDQRTLIENGYIVSKDGKDYRVSW